MSAQLSTTTTTASPQQQPQHKVVVVSGANRGLGLEFVQQLLFSPTPPLRILTDHCSAYTILALTREIDQTKWDPILAQLVVFNQQHQQDQNDNNDGSDNNTNNNNGQFIPRHLVVQQCNVTSQVDIDNLVTFLSQQLYNRVDVLISNAGIIETSPQSAIKDMARFDPSITDIFTVNSIAPVILTNALMPLLYNAMNKPITTIDQSNTIQHDSTINPGVVINRHHRDDPNNIAQSVQCVYVSSDMGSLEFTNMPLCPTYRASKCALNMYIKTFSLQFTDVNFLALSPGWVATDMGSRGGRTPPLHPTQSITGLLAQMDQHCNRSDSGQHVYSYDGKIIPW